MIPGLSSTGPLRAAAILTSMDMELDKLARLAGFVVAHGIWGVSSSGPLIPILGYEYPDSNRAMERYVRDDLAEAVKLAQQALHGNIRDADRAVLVYDTYLHLEGSRVDALLGEAVGYRDDRSFTVAVPYRRYDSPAGFAVHRPKFVKVTGITAADFGVLGDTFFAGVDAHEAAATVWDAHLDPSI